MAEARREILTVEHFYTETSFLVCLAHVLIYYESIEFTGILWLLLRTGTLKLFSL